MNKKLVLELLFISVLTLAVKLPSSPIFYPIPFRDNAFYRFVGQEILSGKLPYRDVWDHKPPLIFYLNASANFLSGNNAWGTWVLEFLSLLLTGLFSFFILRNLFGSRIATVTTVFEFLALFIFLETNIDRGNYPEEYALPLQLLLILISSTYKAGAAQHYRKYFIGLISATILLLKINLVSIPITAVLYILYLEYKNERNFNSLIRTLAGVLFGSVPVFGLLLFYLYLNNLFPYFIDQVFRYNTYYIQTTFGRAISSFIRGLYLLLISQIGICGGAGLIVAFNYLVGNRKAVIISFYCFIIIALLLETVLISLPGRPYSHYYISLLPELTILSGLYFHTIFQLTQVNKRETLTKRDRSSIVTSFVKGYIAYLPLSVSIFFLPISIGISFGFREQFVRYEQEIKIALNYIENNISPKGTFLVWGNEAELYLMTKKNPPSQFAYIYPLITKGYGSQKLNNNFLSELNVNKPQLIIDTSGIFDSYVPPLDPSTKWRNQAGDVYSVDRDFGRVTNYIVNNYHPIETNNQYWKLYQRN